MKFNRLFALTLAAAVLCTGCSNDAASGKPIDAASAYETLSQELTQWDGSINLSTAVDGSIFTEYLEVPSAVALSGQYMQQDGENGKEIFAATTMDYGDSYYYSYTMLGDGVDFVIAMEAGSTDPTSTEEVQNYGEYVDKATFDANAAFGVPQLVFDAGLVKSASTAEDKESGSTVVTFELDAASCEAPVIALLEQLQYIDTETVPVTAEVSSMICSATYTDGQLAGLRYKFSADLTAEGEVMEMDYNFGHTLMTNGDAVDFALPNFEYLVTNTTATGELPVVE